MEFDEGIHKSRLSSATCPARADYRSRLAGTHLCGSDRALPRRAGPDDPYRAAPIDQRRVAFERGLGSEETARE